MFRFPVYLILFLSLLGMLLTIPARVEAAEADMFVQPSGHVPIPMILDGSNIPYVTCTNCSGSTPPPSSRNFPGCTVGTSSTTCLGGATALTYISVQNVADSSTGAIISCAFGTTAALHSSNGVQLIPGQAAAWGPSTNGVPTGQLNCISSVASTPLYVEWN